MTRQKAPWSFAAVDIEVPSSGTREVLLTRASGDWTGWTVDGAIAALPDEQGRMLVPSDAIERRRLVALALDHAEPRVAANAVEAWAARRPREYGRIEPKCDSRVHRVRANAIRAVIQTGAGDGETQLHRMLDDDDERHRVSGIWAASAARSVDMIAHLRFLVQRDPSNDVRRRAAVVARRLEPLAPGRPAEIAS